jgi:hypothetical protein
MPDQVIIDLIKKEMDGWDGTPPPDIRPRDLTEWAKEMEKWGRRVRRDILVLEHHVAELAGRSADAKSMFYGDPGDPPPTEPL